MAGYRRAVTIVARIAAALAPLVASLLVGCATYCEDAATICGFDEAQASDDCSGVEECAALCVIDGDSCDVNDAGSPESKCIAECLAAGEGGT